MGDEEDNPPQCHCKAGRLAIVIGPDGDGTLDAAKAFAAKSGFPSAWFPASKFDTAPPTLQPPNVPDGKGGWSPLAGKLDDAITALSDTIQSCCWYEEVLVMAHGHQLGIYKLLAELMPKLLDRQVSKLVLWICGNSRDKYPLTDKETGKLFAEICAAAAPRECECGCHQEDCRAYDSSGRGPIKCPSPSAPTTVLSAGYYKNSTYKVNEPSSLSLDPTNAKQPFGAPDARLIETTVSEGGAGEVEAVSKAVTDATVFEFNVRDDGNTGGTAKIGFDPSAHLGPTHKKTAKKSTRAAYRGPRAKDKDCPHHDGCLKGVQ